MGAHPDMRHVQYLTRLADNIRETPADAMGMVDVALDKGDGEYIREAAAALASWLPNNPDKRDHGCRECGAGYRQPVKECLECLGTGIEGHRLRTELRAAKQEIERLTREHITA